MTVTRPDPDPVRDLYARLLDAWNRRDAGAYAALFSAEGTLIGFDGTVVAGAGVGQHLAGIFGDHATATYVAKVREVRTPGSGVVLLRAIVGTAELRQLR